MCVQLSHLDETANFNTQYTWLNLPVEKGSHFIHADRLLIETSDFSGYKRIFQLKHRVWVLKRTGDGSFSTQETCDIKCY